jgi:branched-subunit amino acid ABC-type transport system permease component
MEGAGVIQLVLNTIVLASFYALFAVGLALVFGAMKIINFAHGELYMIGGYSLWVFVKAFQSTLPPAVFFFLALVAGALFVGGIGVLVERSDPCEGPHLPASWHP